jgi:hypothetical protein
VVQIILEVFVCKVSDIAEEDVVSLRLVLVGLVIGGGVGSCVVLV